MKYKDKAIERREKPKPPPYTPPSPKDDEGSNDYSADSDSGASVDSEEAENENEKKIASLKAEKEEAVAKEDFDKAQQIKDEIDSLTKEEVSRLKKAKNDAVA